VIIQWMDSCIQKEEEEERRNVRGFLHLNETYMILLYELL
jgi:hypothetical protein